MAAFRRAPLLAGLSASMVALALFVVGLFSIAAYNLRLALETMEQRVEVVAYLGEGARLDEVTRAQNDLLALPGVANVSFVSKDDALRIARAEFPEFGELFSDLDVNPLPASLEMQLAPGFRDSETIETIAQAAEAYPFVEDVRFGREWVDKLFLLRRIGGITALVLGSAFAVVAALIIGTAVRIAIYARKDEIYIMRLVGAKNSFIRGPFLLEGVITGLVGGAFAILLTYMSYVAVYQYVFELSWMPGQWLASGVAAGGAFGLIASGLALHRYLRAI